MSRPARQPLTAQRLRQLLHYDPDTGAITWLQDRRLGRDGCGPLVAAVGEAAGAVDPSTGYLRTSIRAEGKSHKVFVHRAAFALTTGEWPKGRVDHIDGCKTNNRWTNLRDVSARMNNQNRHNVRSDSGSQLLGAYPAKGGKFRSFLRDEDGKYVHLGTFPTAQGAHEAFIEAKRSLHAGCA